MHTFAFIFYILFLISNIFADCPSGTLSGPNKAYCYSVFNKPTDWNSAQANCISIGGYLARVDSAFTNEFFSKTAQANFTVPGRFWLGGAVINGSIGWSDGYNANYSNWAKGQPVIANGVDAIVMHLPNGLWYNENRLGKNPYICEVPIASSPCCTAGWTYFEQVNRCYMTLDVRINFWTDSKNSCLVAGGNLVSIHSDDDEFIVTAIALNYIGYNNPPYIGLCQNANNTWVWSDGTSLDYSKWAPGYPGSRASCAYIYVSDDTTNNGWVNDYGGSGGICQGPSFC